VSTETHPIYLASLALIPSDPSGLSTSLVALEAALSEASDPQERQVVSHKSKSIYPVLAAVKALSPLALSSPGDHLRLFLVALTLARKLLLMSLDIRDAFDEPQVNGGELLSSLLIAHGAQDPALVLIASIAEAAALKEELNKGSLVNGGYPMAALELLQTLAGRKIESDQPDFLPLVKALSGSLKALVTADDDRPHVVGSAAFKNARFLAKEGKAAASFMAIIRHPSVVGDAATSASVLGAMRWFAANDEICKEFLEDGGVLACLGMIQRWMHSPEVVAASLGALRQLSGSDGVKKMMAENEGIQQVLAVMANHGDDDSVLEPALALLASLMLRLPDIATQASECGAIEGIARVMADRPGSHAVQRQACMAVRNLGARNPEIRPLLIDKGLEDFVRQAKSMHPVQCGDVGAAALRDMGCDNYNNGALPAWEMEAPKGGIPR
jgi:hypothetical protein